MESTRRVAPARSVLAGIAATGANANGNSAGKYRNEIRPDLDELGVSLYSK